MNQVQIFERVYRDASCSRIGELTKRAMVKRVEAGGIPGKAPTGYRNLPGTKGDVKVDEIKATFIRWAFSMAAQGESLRVIADFLARHSITAKSGGPMSPSVVRHMLTNPFYIGKVRVGNIVVEGRQKAIVNEELFKKLQRILDEGLD